MKISRQAYNPLGKRKDEIPVENLSSDTNITTISEQLYIYIYILNSEHKEPTQIS